LHLLLVLLLLLLQPLLPRRPHQLQKLLLLLKERNKKHNFIPTPHFAGFFISWVKPFFDDRYLRQNL
jgi:hypothetical protein